ncbi:MAG: hypothetical protein HRU70_12700 [Phycisphaeraceae bacterium]|nr:MAG: hypothetical protein HRU70_12700 [Phycisphaeraceae bacterium]
MSVGMDMLRLLGGLGDGASGVSRTLGRSGGGFSPRAMGGPDFRSVLEQARAGGVSSGVRVTIAEGAGVTLTDEQVGRVSIAADKAEASGASRALVKIDEQWVSVDLATRTVTGSWSPGSGEVAGGIDAVLEAPGAAAGPGVPTGPGTLGLTPQVLKLLSGQTGA